MIEIPYISPSSKDENGKGKEGQYDHRSTK
jgi:hypothetical protein